MKNILVTTDFSSEAHHAFEVAIPTYVRSGLSHFLRASIAETVATHAFPPVLTYHLAGWSIELLAVSY